MYEWLHVEVAQLGRVRGTPARPTTPAAWDPADFRATWPTVVTSKALLTKRAGTVGGDPVRKTEYAAGWRDETEVAPSAAPWTSTRAADRSAAITRAVGNRFVIPWAPDGALNPRSSLLRSAFGASGDRFAGSMCSWRSFGGTAPAVPPGWPFVLVYGQIVPVAHWLKTTETPVMTGAVELPRSTNRYTTIVCEDGGEVGNSR
jgi:hypothetical protein